MQPGSGSIERFLERSIEHWKRGAYRDAYSTVLEALDRLKPGCAGREADLAARVMIQAARCAYLAGRFDESRSYIEKLRKELPGHLERNVSDFLQVVVIEANIERREGKFSKAVEVLSELDGLDLDSAPPEFVSEKYLIEGACYYYANDVASADLSLERALGISGLCRDSRVRARVLTLMGLVADYKGLVRAAEDYLTRARDISREMKDVYGEAAALLNLAILHYREGRLRGVAREAGRARELFERCGWDLGVCRSLIALGNIERILGDLEGAEKLLGEALDTARRGAYGKEMAIAEEFMGDIEFERGNMESAERLYSGSLEFGRRISPLSDLAVEVSRRLGELYMRMGDHRSALSCTREAIRGAQRLSNRFEKALSVRTLAAIHTREGRGKGELLFMKAVETLRMIGAEFELAKTFALHAECLLDGTGAGEDPRDWESGVPGSRDTILRNLLRAESIFDTIGVSHWKQRVDALICRVMGRPAPVAIVGRRTGKGSDVVTLRYSREFFPYDGFAAVSTSMMRVLEQVRFVAETNRPVLITGETGTGKELVARLIHRLSSRARGPFVAVNCAAVPDHLFESEFFGHRKGCFTGALTDRKGLFEEASGGTLFLDEVGELTTLQQVKFLRVLQEKRIRRLGENVERPIDVRILSATNRDIDDELSRNNMRDDFYFRINAEQIYLPPLRKRTEDILAVMLLVFCGDSGSRDRSSDRGENERVVRIEIEALRKLQNYPWPGNVRELVMVLERVRAVAGGRVVTVEMLPERVRVHGLDGFHGRTRLARGVGMGDDERSERIKKVLSLCNGNKSAAAKWLGISRGTLYKELRRNGLDGFIQGREPAM